MRLWLNPAAGISGDMLLGALLDLGAPLDDVRAAVASTRVTGWTLDVREVVRGGLAARHAVVTVTDDVTERHAGELYDAVRRVPVPQVAALAERAIDLIARAEAQLHAVPVDEVHLHELGGVDTVVDVVGVAAALHALGVTAVHSAPVALGSGTVRTAHGDLPAPAPATLALLDGVPVHGVDVAGETVTPTGAALLRAMGAVFGPLPAGTVSGTGYGAGSRDPAGRPNVLQATLLDPGTAGTSVEMLLLLETTVDDVTGERLGDVIADVLAAGALDAWLVPVTGKKGRPAHVVTVLCPPADADTVQDLVLRETGSLGMRRSTVERHALPRRVVAVRVDDQLVRVKIGPYGAKAEHDDVAAVAAARGLTRAEVSARALAAAVDRP